MTGRMPNCPDSNARQVPWYFLTILSFFVFPIIFLIKYTKNIDYAAFFKSVGLVMLLGYSWSFLVTLSGWWVFNPDTMLGFEVLPHLPLEEILFYPLGGALSILVYLALGQYFHFTSRAGKGYLLSIAGITVGAMIAVLISYVQFQKNPFYIISQLVLFNGLSIGIWFFQKRRVILKAAWLTVVVMTVIGFFWNWIAFTQTWWSYHATLGWMFPPGVPVDDWNFFIFAPLAAMSLYECFNRKRQ
ncbi:hypothetical protein K8S19_11835 [bacterium]|nr:hypothetical protein [bacterium]